MDKPKLLTLSDDPIPSGFGRISHHINAHAFARQWDVFALSLAYDGLMPPVFEGQPVPYHVASLQGKPDWPNHAINVINVWQPDIVLVIQDFPYGVQIFNAPLDWSVKGRVLITPVDGVPIHPDWLRTLDNTDAAMTISSYGVEAFRKAGHSVGLCRPGVDLDTFYPLSADERLTLRNRLGIAPSAFVFGTMCQNQGRKAIPLMLRAFFRFAQDKPDARYLLDMEKTSPAGWDIPNLCVQQNWDASKLIYREDCQRAGVTTLNERYNALDAHAVISHREGYGLPLVEAMAAGVVSMAMDYCSGTEICGDGRGVLVPTTGYGRPGTWGGAEDFDPDLDYLVEALENLAQRPLERARIAETGKTWARLHTWQNSADSALTVLTDVYEQVKARRNEATNENL